MSTERITSCSPPLRSLYFTASGILYGPAATVFATSIWNIASFESPEFNLPMYDLSVPDHEGLKPSGQFKFDVTSFTAASPLFSIATVNLTLLSPGFISVGSEDTCPIFISPCPTTLNETATSAVVRLVSTYPFAGSK